MKKKCKGFTLVELLVTIVLLGVIGAIVIYNMTSVSNSSKDTDYERFIAQVKSAASVYADMNQDAFNQLYVNKAFIYVTVGQLIDGGYLDDTLTNPYTNKVIDRKDVIKANLDTTTGGVEFEYPVKDEKKESFLVAMTDYVVWGETYNCMQGIGTYELSISKEDGTLIILDDAKINEYNFKCSFPDKFTKVDANKARTDVPGTYEIKYEWTTESGTKKQSTRNVRVLPKIEPSFNTNHDYNFKAEDPSTYVPSFDGNKWTYLTIAPLIEGADLETTSFTITKKNNNPKGPEVFVCSSNGANPCGEMPVDDGDKTYTIKAIVTGHYDTSYSYEASGSGRFKSELVLPEEYITNGNANAYNASDAHTRDFTIYDTYNSVKVHSPVGIAYYEFKLSNNNTLDKNIEKVDEHVFAKANGNTTKSVSVLEGKGCKGEEKDYKSIFFRAINNDGYVGPWTKIDTKLTNILARLINRGKYNTKSVYIDYDSKKFFVLDNNDIGILSAYTGFVKNAGTSPTVTRRGYAEQQTCDMLVYKHYNYSSPAVENIFADITSWLNVFKTDKLVYYKWKYDGFSKQMYAGTVSANPNATVYYNTYKTVYQNTPVEFWTTTSYYSPFTVYLDQPHKHANESTTAYNAYYYYLNASGLAGQRYVGQTAFVKPIVYFVPKSAVCTGTGAENNPYEIGV